MEDQLAGKALVCKGCGNQLQATDPEGNPACPICSGLDPDSGVPVEVQLPDEFRCVACGQVRKTADILIFWTATPFANPAEGTYYCGCRGWD